MAGRVAGYSRGTARGTDPVVKRVRLNRVEVTLRPRPSSKAVPPGQEQQVYQDILTGPRFGWTATLCEEFRTRVRNGIIHDAETRSRWCVQKTVPSSVLPERSTAGNILLNRTRFHDALKDAFADWVGRLRGGDSALRARMRDRMNEIRATHYQ